MQPRARRQTAAGELIYEAGDPAEAIFLAFPADPAAVGPRGIVELVLPTNDDGAQAHAEHVVAGDAFGEFEFVAAGLIEGKIVRRSTARTIVACELYRIPYSLLAAIVAETEAVRGRLIRLSMERLISALNVKSTHMLGDRDIALANWLLDAADNVGIAEGRHVRFSRAIGQREIADALGVSRETISLRLNEWERAGLLNTGGQSQRFEILDYPRVALRAAVRKHDAQGAIDAALAEIDADLDRGELVRARNVALDMLVFFPASPELRHRIALASIRAGAVSEAVGALAQGGYATGGDIDLLRDRTILGLRHPAVAPARLFFGSGEPDSDSSSDTSIEERVPVLIEDIAAIEARARKEMAFATADADGRRRHAAVSALHYQAIFDATGGIYAGINAAMMSGVAGHHDRSSELARRIIAEIGDAPDGYWQWATLGEAHMLLGEEAAALSAFADAAGADDATDGRMSSTRLQVRRIGAAVGGVAEAVLGRLPVGHIAVYSGRLFRGRDLDEAQQESHEAALRPRIESALTAGNIRYLFGSLACGADILVAEAALAAGLELHVVLPFPVEDFIEASVAIGNPPDGPDRWVSRFWSCLNRSTSFATAVDLPAHRRALDAHFYHCFRLAAGLALLRADTLTSAATMIAVTDGRGGNNMAGTSRAKREWTAIGQPLVDISMDMELRHEADDDGGPDVFAAVVFLWPTEPVVDLADICRVAAAATGYRLDFTMRSSRDRRTGAAARLPDVKTALDVLAALADHCRETGTPVRLVGDFGPVLDARSQVSDALISRLPGASDLIGFPPAIPLATMAFAAQARLEAGDRVGFAPIGRTAPAAEGRPLAAREVYALSFGAAPAALYSLATVSAIQG